MYVEIGLAFLVGILFGFTLHKKVIKRRKGEIKKNDVSISDSEFEDLADSGLKMVVCVREDLKMSKGKIAAQVGHAVCGLFRQALEGKNEHNRKCLEVWDDVGAKKITLKLKSLEQLKEIQGKIKAAGLNNIVIQDAV